MSHDIETIVIGAGVVGLAVARALSLRGHEVVILEQHAIIGSEVSSRNSEVIHAGIYYPTGSLRAKLCVAGKARCTGSVMRWAYRTADARNCWWQPPKNSCQS